MTVTIATLMTFYSLTIRTEPIPIRTHNKIGSINLINPCKAQSKNQSMYSPSYILERPTQSMKCQNCGNILLESREEILDKMKNGITHKAKTCDNCGQAYT
ncbi:MAG: hypothetical protein QXN55_09005 [Candidatus Nitrosotenuis sp.]